MIMITYGVILEEWNGTFSNCLLKNFQGNTVGGKY